MWPACVHKRSVIHIRDFPDPHRSLNVASGADRQLLIEKPIRTFPIMRGRIVHEVYLDVIIHRYGLVEAGVDLEHEPEVMIAPVIVEDCRSRNVRKG